MGVAGHVWKETPKESGARDEGRKKISLQARENQENQ